MTPAICDAAAERLIGAYLKEVGAFGNLQKCAHALEMLISKAALGVGMATSDVYAMDLLLRTAYNVAARMEQEGKGTIQ